MLVEVEPYAEQVAGHLWSTRWDKSRDVLWLWTLVDGRFSDTLVPDDAADDELRDYDAGCSSTTGSTYGCDGWTRWSRGICGAPSSGGRCRSSPWRLRRGRGKTGLQFTDDGADLT